jgi:hypothetical protein
MASSHKKLPHAKDMDLETSYQRVRTSPAVSFPVPHDFPAQIYLLEAARCGAVALHCPAAWPNKSASRYQIVHRRKEGAPPSSHVFHCSGTAVRALLSAEVDTHLVESKIKNASRLTN